MSVSGVLPGDMVEVNVVPVHDDSLSSNPGISSSLSTAQLADVILNARRSPVVGRREQAAVSIPTSTVPCDIGPGNVPTAVTAAGASQALNAPLPISTVTSTNHVVSPSDATSRSAGVICVTSVPPLSSSAAATGAPASVAAGRADQSGVFANHAAGPTTGGEPAAFSAVFALCVRVGCLTVGVEGGSRMACVVNMFAVVVRHH